MEIARNQKRPPDWRQSSTPIRECIHDGRGITSLPSELVRKIFANLSGKDLVVCQRVIRPWKDIVDSTPMLARAFYRRMHPLAPVPGPLATVKGHYLTMRNWLEHFSEQGRELVLELDELIAGGARLSPERLFFSLAKLLAETPILHSQKACTVKHADFISSTHFSPDGRYLITASHDETAKISGLIDGQWQEIATLTHPDAVKNAYFSPMGYCVTHCMNQTIQIWEAREGMAGQWRSHVTLPHNIVDTHTSTSCSANGNYLVTVPAPSFAVEIHQHVNGQWQRQTTLLDGYHVDYACFHPQEDILVTVHSCVHVTIWQLVENRWNNASRFQHPGYVFYVYFSPDGNRFLVTSQKPLPSQYQTKIYIYNRAGGAWCPEGSIPFARRVEATRFSPKGDKLVTMFEDGVTIWQFSDNSWQEVRLPGVVTFTNARFSPDGEGLVTTSRHNTAIIWRELKGQWQEQATLHLGGDSANVVTDGCFSPYGHHLVIISKNRDATIWGIVNGTWKEKSDQPLGRVLKGTFSPDGLHFLARSQYCTATIWTCQRGQL